MTLTLQQAKDEVAKTIYGFDNWREFISDGPGWRVYRDACDKVAEVYAKASGTKPVKSSN